jgi:hypothetical protein
MLLELDIVAEVVSTNELNQSAAFAEALFLMTSSFA